MVFYFIFIFRKEKFCFGKRKVDWFIRHIGCWGTEDLEKILATTAGATRTLPKHRHGTAHFCNFMYCSMAFLLQAISFTVIHHHPSRSSPANRMVSKHRKPKNHFLKHYTLARKSFLPESPETQKSFSLPSFFLSIAHTTFSKLLRHHWAGSYQSMTVYSHRKPEVPDAHPHHLQYTLDYSKCGVCSWRHTR
jgi:hypothetical protein